MTDLGIPTMSNVTPKTPAQSEPVVFTEGHHFRLTGTTSVEELANQLTAPLSAILQVTKRRDFDCDFCSEILQLPDPTLTQLDTMRANLTGVKRVFLSGGEPLMRKDFGEIVDMYSEDFILGIPRTRPERCSMPSGWPANGNYWSDPSPPAGSISQQLMGDTS